MEHKTPYNPRMSTPTFAPPQTETDRIAAKLVELVRAGKHIDAIKTLYADNARHVEPFDMPGCEFSRVNEGKTKLLELAEQWHKITTIHDSSVGDPTVNGDQFLCDMMLDCTSSEGPMAGQRMKMSETCQYTVSGGKITDVKFFYRSMGM
jgi:hypothetical protein